MLHKEIIVVCFEIHTKHTNTLCGQNIDLLNVKLGGTYCNQCMFLKGLVYGCRIYFLSTCVHF